MSGSDFPGESFHVWVGKTDAGASRSNECVAVYSGEVYKRQVEGVAFLAGASFLVGGFEFFFGSVEGRSQAGHPFSFHATAHGCLEFFLFRSFDGFEALVYFGFDFGKEHSHFLEGQVAVVDQFGES